MTNQKPNELPAQAVNDGEVELNISVLPETDEFTVFMLVDTSLSEKLKSLFESQGINTIRPMTMPNPTVEMFAQVDRYRQLIAESINISSKYLHKEKS